MPPQAEWNPLSSSAQIHGFGTGMLVKSQQFGLGLVVTPVLFHKIWSPSGARGMIFEKCYDLAKENNRRTSRVKRPVLWLTPVCLFSTKMPVQFALHQLVSSALFAPTL